MREIDSLGKVVECDILVIGGGLAGALAAIRAREMGVKKLVITHMAPYYMQKFDPQKDAESTFGKEVILAKDLMEMKI